MLKRLWHLPEIQFTGIRSSAVPVLPSRNMSITGDQILTPRAIRKRFEGHAIHPIVNNTGSLPNILLIICSFCKDRVSYSGLAEAPMAADAPAGRHLHQRCERCPEGRCGYPCCWACHHFPITKYTARPPPLT
jgi:hypothetical protein